MQFFIFLSGGQPLLKDWNVCCQAASPAKKVSLRLSGGLLKVSSRYRNGPSTTSPQTRNFCFWARDFLAEYPNQSNSIILFGRSALINLLAYEFRAISRTKNLHRKKCGRPTENFSLPSPDNYFSLCSFLPRGGVAFRSCDRVFSSPCPICYRRRVSHTHMHVPFVVMRYAPLLTMLVHEPSEQRLVSRSEERAASVREASPVEGSPENSFFGVSYNICNLLAVVNCSSTIPLMLGRDTITEFCTYAPCFH